MNDLSGALCVGRWWLFDSIVPADHVEARAICAGCPVYDACRELVDVELTFRTQACSKPVGTWAGQLYGSPQSRHHRLPRACGTERGYYQHRYRDEEACAMCRKAHGAAKILKREQAAACEQHDATATRQWDNLSGAGSTLTTPPATSTAAPCARGSASRGL